LDDLARDALRCAWPADLNRFICALVGASANRPVAVVLQTGSLCLNEERFAANIDIVHEGDVPRSALVLTHGMAFRYRLMPDGKRQILTFMIPGDIFGLQAFLLTATDHSIGTLVPTRVAMISRDTVFDLFDNHPRIGAALWWSALQQNAIHRERIVALGRRSSRGRIAYLLCELVWLQRAVGLSDGHAIRLPLTQVELADALGLTSVGT
jgi:CRP-like cAMP-binding protein